ncbi:MAG: hypothetical protein ACPGVU_04360 [Limisphaerales bacterium]
MSDSDSQETGPAVDYVHQELVAARKTASRTKWGGLFLLLLICGYFGTLTYLIVFEALAPKSLAQFATGQALVLIDSNATPLAKSLENETRNFLHGVPDQLIGRMPAIRERFEEQLLNFARSECRSQATRMGDQLEYFLAQNKDSVTEFVEAANDKEAIARLADELSEEFVSTLDVKPEGSSESLSDKLKLTLDALQRAEAQLERLAKNEKLTPKEADQRRAIAVIARAAEESL